MQVARLLIDSDSQPELRQRALDNVARGVQRLLAFEDGSSGRFRLFCGGSGPTDLQYTIRALQVFTAIDEVHPVDPALLTRIRRTILTAASADGSWSTSDRPMGQESPLDVTAFATWVLSTGGATEAEIEPARHWLESRSGAIGDDPYALALYLLAASGPRPEAARRLARIVGDDRFRVHRLTLMGGFGRTGTDEALALAALALLRQPDHVAAVARLVDRLERSRRGTGTWGSTTATILATEALLLARRRPVAATGSLVVTIDGQEVGRGRWTPATADLHVTIDAAAAATPGLHRVDLAVVRPDGAPPFDVAVGIVSRWHVPDEVPAPATGLRLALDRTATRTAIGQEVEVRLVLTNDGDRPTSMVVVQVATSPLIDLDRVEGPHDARDEQAGRTNLYLAPLAVGEERTLRLVYRAGRAGRAAGPRIAAYDYYDPEDRAEAAGPILEVTAR